MELFFEQARSLLKASTIKQQEKCEITFQKAQELAEKYPDGYLYKELADASIQENLNIPKKTPTHCVYVIGGGNFGDWRFNNVHEQFCLYLQSKKYIKKFKAELLDSCPAKDTVITFNGDSYQDDSPFTLLIEELMKLGYRVESVRDKAGFAFGKQNKAVTSWKVCNTATSSMLYADDKVVFNQNRATHVIVFAMKMNNSTGSEDFQSLEASHPATVFPALQLELIVTKKADGKSYSQEEVGYLFHDLSPAAK